MNSESVESTKPNILLVEDNPVAARIQKMLMQCLNCDVDVASTGEEAIELFTRIHYDLILMDIGLPGIDGIQACVIIRKYELEKNIMAVPMVAVTANADPRQRLLCEQAGMCDVVTKPLTPAKAKHILSILKPDN